MKDFIKGLKGGIPIGLGYLSVSFAFGIMAVSLGFEWWQAVIISMTNLTSAGQLAGINIMINPALYFDMLLSQLTINVRYSFMSVSLSQKVTPQFTGLKRWILGFFMTDEIFAVASNEKEVSVKFFSGLTVFPYIGWTLGTLLGSVLGNVLPAIIMNALCLAIYGMFVAIVAPKAKGSLTFGCRYQHSFKLPVLLSAFFKGRFKRTCSLHLCYCCRCCRCHILPCKGGRRKWITKAFLFTFLLWQALLILSVQFPLQL